jgi:FkbM family methyltransferase
MKQRLKNLLENNIFLRPFLYASFIYYGEINIAQKKREKKEIKPVSPADKRRLGLIDKWNLEEGDKTFRLIYNLNKDSVIFDLGGFEGDWSAEMAARYGSNIFIFEPYIPFYKNIESRFLNNKKIKVYPFGLGAKTEKVSFYQDGNASSIHKFIEKEVQNDQIFEIELVDAFNFLENFEFKKIDLIKINIEGAEFELLERLIEKDKIKFISNLQIQFHYEDENSEFKMISIQKELSKTHKITYQFDFIWENWELII